MSQTPPPPPGRQPAAHSPAHVPGQPITSARPNPSAGSHAAVRRKHGGGWLPWAILGLLALLALAIWALAKAADDDDETTSTTDVATTSVVGAEEPAATSAPGGAPFPGAAPAPAAVPTTAVGTPGVTALPGAPVATIAPGTPGTLTANGQDVFAAAAAPGGLGAFAGTQATGTVRVESVVSDEGFWVGASPEQRVFVFLTPEARGSGGESPFQIVAGQTIEVVGTVDPLDPAVMTNVAPEEGAEQLTAQAFFVRASSVRLVG